MIKEQTIGQRLAWLLSDQKIGITDFAGTIGVDGSQFGKIVNDKMGITLKQVLEISSKYSVRAGWIIEGELPVYKQKSGPVEPDFREVMNQIKEYANGIISLTESKKVQVRVLDQETNTDRPRTQVVKLSGIQKTDKRPKGK